MPEPDTGPNSGSARSHTFAQRLKRAFRLSLALRFVLYDDQISPRATHGPKRQASASRLCQLGEAGVLKPIVASDSAIWGSVMGGSQLSRASGSYQKYQRTLSKRQVS